MGEGHVCDGRPKGGLYRGGGGLVSVIVKGVVIGD